MKTLKYFLALPMLTSSCSKLIRGISRVAPKAQHATNRQPASINLDPTQDMREFIRDQRFPTILADPPWRFQNSTGKIAPEHRRLSRYGTLSLDEIKKLPIGDVAAPTAHLYLWTPNALLAESLSVMAACRPPKVKIASQFHASRSRKAGALRLGV